MDFKVYVYNVSYLKVKAIFYFAAPAFKIYRHFHAVYRQFNYNSLLSIFAALHAI